MATHEKTGDGGIDCMNFEILMFLLGVLGVAGGVYINHITKAYPLGVYAYPVARIKVMYGRMLKEQKLQSLIEAYSADDVIAAFEGTIYEKHIPDTKNIEEIEQGLSRSLAATYQKVVSMSPVSAKEFFSLVSSRYDLENLKKIVSAKFVGENIPPLLPGSLSESMIAKFSEAESVTEVVELVKGTKYSPIMDGLPTQVTPTQFQRTMDKYLYETLLGKAKTTIIATVGGVINDPKFLPEVYGVNVDLINIKMALRQKQDLVPPETIKELFINNGYYLGERDWNALAEADSVSSAISALEKHPFYSALNDALPEYGKEQEVFILEHALNKFYYKTIRSTFYKQAFGLTPIACFLLLKEMEITALTTVLKGISLNIPKQQLQGLIVYPN
jgi:V/A-type H+/Na+-transporting ATPase subunit C